VNQNRIGKEGAKAVDKMLHKNRKNMPRKNIISLMVLTGFIAVVGIAAVAIAFTLFFHPALVGIGSIVGLFGLIGLADGAYNKGEPPSHPRACAL